MKSKHLRVIRLVKDSSQGGSVVTGKSLQLSKQLCAISSSGVKCYGHLGKISGDFDNLIVLTLSCAVWSLHYEDASIY